MTPTDTNKLPAEVLRKMAKAYCYADPCIDCLENGKCSWFKDGADLHHLTQAQAAYDASPGPGLEAENARLREVVTVYLDALYQCRQFERDNPHDATSRWDAHVEAVEEAEYALRTAIARAKGE